MFLFPGTVSSQDKKEFRKDFLEAEYFFLREEFQEAAFLYNELLNREPVNANLQFLTGASWLSVPGNKDKAIPFLERAVSSISAAYREGSYREMDSPRESLFALARAYHISNRFDEAVEYYKKYKNVMKLSDVAEIEFVHKQMESVDLARQLILDTLKFDYTELDELINSGTSNFNAVYSEEDSSMVYMVQRPFYSAILYTRFRDGTWLQPRVINPELEADGNCRVTAISSNGKELYLVKNEDYDKNIYVSRYQEDLQKWTSVKPLPDYINTLYNESHASVSADGQTLFFTSDRPGGRGAMDIYISKKNVNGEWGEPANAGPTINTIYSEETPFLTPRGNILFFSSMGHAVMGGFDVFYSRLLPSGQWSQPANLGFPINTTDDDLFYFPLGEGKRGFMTSYQKILPQGRIILVNLDNEEPGRKYVFRGRISTADNLEMETPAEVKVKDTRTGEVVAVSKTDRDYSLELEGGDYTMEIKADKYGTTTKDVSIIPEINQNTIVVNSELLPNEVKEGKFLVMKNILFGFDSDVLNTEAKLELEKLYMIMSRYPDIYVRVRGHADAIGPADYNLELSRRRSRSVLNYLVGKGISKERFISTAVGESGSIARNVNPDGSDNPEGRRLNRQVEISLINNEHENINVQEILVPDHLKPLRKIKWMLVLEQRCVMKEPLPDSFMNFRVESYLGDSVAISWCEGFKNKQEAIEALNEALDNGFEEARIIPSEELGNMKAQITYEKKLPSPPFTIQLLALKNPADLSLFKDPAEIQLFKSSDGYHRYVTGVYNNYEKAKNDLHNYVDKGYTDAFVMELGRYTKIYRPDNNRAFTPKVYYTIQFTATRKSPDQKDIEYFRNFRIIRGEDGFYRCSTGIFTLKEEAQKELQKIKKLGFTDAFISTIQIDNPNP